MQRLTFKTQNGPVEYTITHRQRVKKRLHMELDENGGLVVVAPRHWSKGYVNATLAQNTSHIERFLLRARQRFLTPLQYVDGEQHLYLGESYPLNIHHITGRKCHVAVSDGQIHIETPHSKAEKIRIELQHWYQGQAARVFAERLRNVAQRTSWVDGNHIPLKLRRMKRTWGNCSSKGVIKLNTHLVKAPLVLIDSVIAHELCHLEEMHHGKAFYALLETLNPEWRRHRARLRSDGSAYLL